jgi:hypothetical protein
MKRFILTTFITLLLFASRSLSQPPQMTVEQYIETFKDTAIEEMQKHRIPASIKLAQGILESGSGNSELARLANNHFGIKCHKEWTGKTFHQDDDAKNECFRKYKDAIESYHDHSHFLTSRDRYAALFNLEITDYKGWAYGLKAAGYATNPRYPEMLIRIIEENGLAKYDTPQGQKSAVNTRNPEPGTRNPELNAPKFFGRGGNDRVIFLNNGVKFILAREEDDFYNIAGEFGIYGWQVRKYNELGKGDGLVPGEKVYLERKKRKCGYDRHVVQAGETLRSISQDYGIRLKALSGLNGLEPGSVLGEGVEVRLR